ncbi:MAG: hypothetical protein U9Q04_06870 [Campylobacterota bacterium]|nr:hypothetical protein [Campylobacterota bacterium]
MNNIKMIHGIDSLYYFCESNDNYDNLFLDILDQIEDKKGIFEKKDIEYENSDINIHIKDTPLNYLGKAEGFYWFKDINEFFKIGFKDYKSNRGLNDIRVQLQANGIYSIGIKSIISFINDDLLKDYVSGYNPITRADLNTFIQHDFSFINKEMFVTRKRNYATISEIGNHKSLQTIYVGKKPFLLRIYNKKEELKKSSKKELMYEYFSNNGFDIEDHIFNIEFELHRTHLKHYGITTVDDILLNASSMFKMAMDDIRLIDISNITDNDIKNNSKSRADTLPIWEDIKQSYTLDSFLQSSIPLERIKRKISIYDDTKFESEMIALLRRAFINNLQIMPHHLDGYYFKAKDSLTKTTTDKQMNKIYEELPNYINPATGKKEKARVLEDGTIINPVKVVSVKELKDYDLLIYLDKLTNNKGLSDHDNNLWSIAYKEAMNRDLIPVLKSDESRSKGKS